MDSRQLLPAQARKMHQALQPGMCYLTHLKTRMERVAFPPDDRLYLLVKKAHESMHDLFIAMHYLSCDGGTGNPRRRD